MKTRVIWLWSGQRPSGAELEDRIRRTLRIVRSEDYRALQDRNGHRVHVELDHVRDHVGLSNDPTRWRLIPLIVPTIKRVHRKRAA